MARPFGRTGVTRGRPAEPSIPRSTAGCAQPSFGMDASLLGLSELILQGFTLFPSPPMRDTVEVWACVWRSPPSSRMS